MTRNERAVTTFIGMWGSCAILLAAIFFSAKYAIKMVVVGGISHNLLAALLLWVVLILAVSMKRVLELLVPEMIADFRAPRSAQA